MNYISIILTYNYYYLLFFIYHFSFMFLNKIIELYLYIIYYFIIFLDNLIVYI